MCVNVYSRRLGVIMLRVLDFNRWICYYRRYEENGFATTIAWVEMQLMMHIYNEMICPMICVEMLSLTRQWKRSPRQLKPLYMKKKVGKWRLMLQHVHVYMMFISTIGPSRGGARKFVKRVKKNLLPRKNKRKEQQTRWRS